MIQYLIELLQYIQTWSYQTWIIIFLSIALIIVTALLITVIKGSTDAAKGFLNLWR